MFYFLIYLPVVRPHVLIFNSALLRPHQPDMLLQARLQTTRRLRFDTASKASRRQLNIRTYHRMSIFQSLSSPFVDSAPSAHPRLGTRMIQRAYATSYGSPSWQTHSSAKRAIWVIIGLNTAVFCTWQYAIQRKDQKLLQQLQQHATVSWDNIKDGRYSTIVTSAFSHQTLPHFAFNMITLHTFGSILSIVPGVGAVHVFALCIGSAIAGSTGFLYHQSRVSATAADQRSGLFGTRTRQIASGLGASGMVMGAGAAAACLMPFAPLMIFPIPFAIPMWAVTGLYFVVDVFFLESGSRIGHAAHLGGSVFGVLYYFSYLRRFGGVTQLLQRIMRR